MKIILNGIAILLIVFVSGWLLYYAKHNHDPMGNRIDAEKTYMLVGCGIGAVIGILCGIYDSFSYFRNWTRHVNRDDDWNYSTKDKEEGESMAAEVKKEVSFDVFGQLDFRAGTILTVEDVEKSTKLTKLTVDLGEDKPRTIVCSLREVREDYKTVEGKQALFLVNLAPRKIMGIESHGMLVTLGYDDGIADTLLFPEHPLPNGTRAS